MTKLKNYNKFPSTRRAWKGEELTLSSQAILPLQGTLAEPTKRSWVEWNCVPYGWGMGRGFDITTCCKISPVFCKFIFLLLRWIWLLHLMELQSQSRYLKYYDLDYKSTGLFLLLPLSNLKVGHQNTLD